MDVSTILYIFIILVALAVIIVINKDFFLGLVGNVKKIDIPRPIVTRPVVKEEPAPVVSKVVATPSAPAQTPVADDTWTCTCGAVNTRKFCAECGEKRPEKKEIKCPACGYVPEEGEKIPKFCPECGAKMEA